MLKSVIEENCGIPLKQAREKKSHCTQKHVHFSTALKKALLKSSDVQNPTDFSFVRQRNSTVNEFVKSVGLHIFPRSRADDTKYRAIQDFSHFACTKPRVFCDITNVTKVSIYRVSENGARERIGCAMRDEGGREATSHSHDNNRP